MSVFWLYSYFVFATLGVTQRECHLLQQAMDYGLSYAARNIADLDHAEGKNAQAIEDYARGVGVFVVQLPSQRRRSLAGDGLEGDVRGDEFGREDDRVAGSVECVRWVGTGSLQVLPPAVNRRRLWSLLMTTATSPPGAIAAVRKKPVPRLTGVVQPPPLSCDAMTWPDFR
jgi:hypothetical protein